MSDYGWFWHAYPDQLVTCLTIPLEERVRRIRHIKPAREVEMRLRLLQPVRGSLPPAVVEAWRVYAEAEQALAVAQRAYDKAWRARIEAWQTHFAEIEALHREECPDCPWDGQTVFPGGLRDE